MSYLNRICYSVTVIVILYIILLIIKKIVELIYNSKYKNLKYVGLDDDLISDGTIAYSIDDEDNNKNYVD